MKKVLLLAVVLAVSSAAWADLWVDVEKKWTVEDVTTKLPGGGLAVVDIDVYWVHFIADDPDDMASMWHPNPGTHGLDGPLHQAWGLGLLTTPEMLQIEDQIAAAQLTSDDADIDSHLLLSSRKPNLNDPGDITFAGGTLVEDGPNEYGQTYGIGTSLGGCDVAIMASGQALDLAFVQVAVPQGSTQVHMDGYIQKGASTETVRVDLWLGEIPEPATAGLLAVGAVALFLRRRAR